ncbi:hypothetical protein [Paraburkholderia caledonica]|uniref:hypothetical protein n=1 Tax=Paraburkholderia caledonica TaxID=134536 RepID=UPI0005A63C3F|nr:hypothetical protein [Paraburkholderia caledonica]
MTIHYDYRYVIACSGLPEQFRRDLRGLASGRITTTYDYRTRIKERVSPEAQCRRIAEIAEGFEALHSSGYALHSPWDFRGKHLQLLIDRWSAQHMTPGERAERCEHWCQCLLWIRKRQLISLLNAWIRTRASPRENDSRRCTHVVGYVRPAIPILTREKVLEVLTEQRGSLRRAARALGTTTHSICEVLREGRSPETQLPPGLTILPGGSLPVAGDCRAAPAHVNIVV